VKQNVATRVLIGCGILAAACSYACWTAQRTAFDTSATGDLAHELLTSAPVQESITEKLQEEVSNQFARADLDPEIATAVQAAVNDPEFADAFADAITEIHRQLLEGDGGEVMIDTGSVTQSVSNALYSIDPTLAEQLQSGEPLRVDLGDADLPELGKTRDLTRTLMWLTLALAIVMLAGAVAVAKSQRDAVGRIGRRIALLSIGPFVMFVVFPLLLRQAHQDATTVISDAMSVYRDRVLPSAIVLLAGGLTVWLIALALPKADEPDRPSPRSRRPSPPADMPVPLGDPRAAEKMYL
jgi:hypothetical protein